MDNTAGLLGIAKKAGLREIGEDSVFSASHAAKARLIMSASDASDGSKRRACNLAANSNTAYVVLPYSKYELGNLIGRGLPGMLSITDIGMAANFTAKLSDQYPEQYKEAAEILAKKLARATARKTSRPTDGNNTTGKRRTNK